MPGRKGFTLIEILVATAILALIFSIVFGTFFYTVTVAEEQEEHAALLHRGSFILNTISRSISSAYVPSALSGVDEEEAGFEVDLEEPEEEIKPPVFLGTNASIEEGNADSLDFITTNSRFGGDGGRGEITFINYMVKHSSDVDVEDWFKDEGNPLVLTCSTESYFSVPAEGDERPVGWSQNVHSLNFEYFDGSEWSEEWDYEEENILPRAVKVELELGIPGGAVRSFSTIARVHVNAVLEEIPDDTPEEAPVDDEEAEELEEVEDTDEDEPEDDEAEE